MRGDFESHDWSAIVAGMTAALVLTLVPARGQDTPEHSLPAAFPPAAPLLGLEQLAALAQENSPKLRVAAEEIERTRGHAIQAGLWPNPTASTGSPQVAGSDSQYFAFLSQEIITAGKLRLSRAAAVQEVVKAELAFVRARFDLLTQVRQQFYVVLAGQRRVEILKTLVDIAQKSKETATRLENAGEGSRTDVLLLEIELQRATLGLENAETILEADRRQLAAFIGMPQLVIESVAGDLVAPVLEHDEDELRGTMLEVNALAIAAQVEIHRSRILLRRSRVEPIPNPRFMGGFQYSVTPLNNQAIFQVDLPIPVFDRNQGNIRSARAAVGKSVAALGDVENELVALLADSLGRFRAACQQVTRYEKEILPAARDAQAITQRGYVQGQFDFLRLLQAQRTLVEADLGYVNSQADRWTTAAEIAGLLQEERFPPPIER